MKLCELKIMQIETRRTLAEDFEEKQPLIIGTLNGAFVFMAGESQASEA